MANKIICNKENIPTGENNRLLQKQEFFEKKIKDEDPNDPLLPWVEYTNWLEKHESLKVKCYKKVLYKCVNTFKYQERYKNDERFVRICIKFALLRPNTMECCAKYLTNGIGSKSAYFYLVCAEKYALSQQYKKANQVFERGISDAVIPLELLQNGHKKFHEFLVKKMLNGNEIFHPTCPDLMNIKTEQEIAKCDHEDEVSCDEALPKKPENLLVSTCVKVEIKEEKIANEFNEFNVDFSKVPLFIEEPEDPARMYMYCKEKVYANNTEYQFEEIRAAQYLKLLAAQKQRESQVKKSALKDKKGSSVKSEKKVPTSVTKSSVVKNRNIPDSGRKTVKGKDSETKSVRRKLSVDGGAKGKGEFGGLVKKSLAFGSQPNEVPSDSFINHTINTKEAMNEMQQLWFSKPVSPHPSMTRQTKSVVPNIQNSREAVDLRRKTFCSAQESAIPIYVDESCLDARPPPNIQKSKPKEQFAIYVDESCLDGIQKIGLDSPVFIEDLRKVKKTPLAVDEGLKENLVLDKNAPPKCPFIEEQQNDDFEEDIENTSWPCVPCNTTGITETCNFTQAFQANRITLASTPNTKRFPPGSLDVNANSPELVTQPDDNRAEIPDKKAELMEPAKNNVVQPHTTLNGRKLSTIAETSREYKSSSSGSSVSAVSKLTAFTPLPGEDRKTLFASKTQSTFGYEASSEFSVDWKSNGPTDFTLSASNRPKKEELSGISRKKDDVDPFAVELLDKFLEKMDFPKEQHHKPGCHFIFTKPPNLKVNSQLTLDDRTFDVKKMIGEGAYAKVFKVQDVESGVVKVVKYQKPAFPWEFYITREIHSRAPLDKRFYFMNIEDAYIFDNASFFITQPVEYGDLLTALNLYRTKQGKPMSDYLSMYFTVQMMEILEILHSCKIIHGDVKPDNFLVTKFGDKLQLQLIDFGRSIDMTLFPEGTTFTKVVTTEGFTCIEMQTGRPWTYQIDLYGLANCIHCLLFGEYMDVIKKPNGWETKRNIPRYLSKAWKEIFNVLLNVPNLHQMPSLSALRNLLMESLKASGPHCDLIKLTNFLENH